MKFFASHGFTLSRISPWWVKITTISPHCLYYFGPFDSFEEAIQEQVGYLEDIETEGARGISISIERGDPHRLTVFDGDAEFSPPRIPHARTFSRFIS
jgi:hypothetical protein